MTRLAAALAACAILLLPGCTDQEGNDPTSATPNGGTDPASPGGVLGANGTTNVTLETFTKDGHFTAGIHPPAAAGEPLEQQVTDEFTIDVPDDVDEVLLELTWTGSGPTRPKLELRAISGQQSYHYGGTGSGLRDDPDTVRLEAPAPSYDVTPIADTAAADCDFKLYVTFARGGPVPEGHTAIPQA